MNGEDIEKATPEHLIAKANESYEKADRENTQLEGGHERKLLFHLEAQFFLATAATKRSEASAEQDRRREHRRFVVELVLEILVVLLIGAEIVLSLRAIREGEQQIEAVKAETGTLQSLAASQAESLKILQEQQAERAKRPKLVLYVGDLPAESASVQLKSSAYSTQNVGLVDIAVRNQGEAPIGESRLHAVMPDDVAFSGNSFVTVPEFEQPARPNTHRVTLQLPPLPAGQTFRLHIEIYVPKGRPTLKIPFTIDAIELNSVVSLGSIKLVPPRSE